MKVKVEACYSGHDKHSFRLTFKHNGKECRESVPGRVWGKEQASEARTLLEKLYGVTRRWIKFVHR